MNKITEDEYRLLSAIIATNDDHRSIEEVLADSFKIKRFNLKKMKKLYFKNKANLMIEFVRKNTFEDRFVEVNFSVTHDICCRRRIEHDFNEENFTEFVDKKINIKKHLDADKRKIKKHNCVLIHIRHMNSYEDIVF